MARKYCQNCRQYVDTKKNFHSIAFVLLVIFVWMPLLLVEAVLVRARITAMTPQPL
jgi:hypothetical protein